MAKTIKVKDKDDELVKDLFESFLRDESIQDKIYFFTEHKEIKNRNGKKDITGWENWLKMEFIFHVITNNTHNVKIALEPAISDQGKQRADLSVNNNLFIELKRKIKMENCIKYIGFDIKKYIINCKNNCDKVYFVGLFNIEGCNEIGSKFHEQLNKLHLEYGIKPTVIMPPTHISNKDVHYEHGYYVTILKHQNPST